MIVIYWVQNPLDGFVADVEGQESSSHLVKRRYFFSFTLSLKRLRLHLSFRMGAKLYWYLWGCLRIFSPSISSMASIAINHSHSHKRTKYYWPQVWPQVLHLSSLLLADNIICSISSLFTSQTRCCSSKSIKILFVAASTSSRRQQESGASPEPSPCQ